MAGRTYLGVCLAIMLWSGSATAGPAATAGGEVTATKDTAGPVRAADSGAVDTAATVGPLAIGARVQDPFGAPLGNVARLTTDKTGVSIAEVRHGEDVISIPVRDLSIRRGAVVSRRTAADLKASGAVR